MPWEFKDLVFLDTLSQLPTTLREGRYTSQLRRKGQRWAENAQAVAKPIDGMSNPKKW